MTEGSRTFEEALAELIQNDKITRAEGLANADSPTNLMWRLNNEPSNTEYNTKHAFLASTQAALDDIPSFTEITLDVRPR